MTGVGILVKKLLIVLVILGGGVAGGVYWLQRPRVLNVEENLFTYATVQRGTMSEAISATGLLYPRDTVVVISELPGMVVDVPVKVNDIVYEGELLCRLDDSKVILNLEKANHGIVTAQAAVAQADALLHAADIAHKKQVKIADKGGFLSDLEEAEYKLKAAKAGLLVAQAQLEQAKTMQREAELHRTLSVVRVPRRQPPFLELSPKRQPYLVLDRKVQLGQFVGPTGSTPLFTLATDLSQMEVHAEVAEGDIGRVKKGLKTLFTVSAFGETDVHFEGVVKDIRPVPNNVRGAIFYTTIIEVTNQKDPETNEWRLRPGMTAVVDIVRQEHLNVWKVPTAAVNFQMEMPYQNDAAKERMAAFKKRPDHAEWRAVWVWDSAQQRPAPVFVRLERDGQKGFKDNEFIEVLEWEAGREPAASSPSLKVITGAPPARTPGIFEQPTNIRVSLRAPAFCGPAPKPQAANLGHHA